MTPPLNARPRTAAIAALAIAAAAATALPQGAFAISDWQTGTQPHAIALDPAGNIFTPNSSAQTVTKLTPAGMPVDPSGSPSLTWATAGPGAFAIATDRSGNVYVTDSVAGTLAKHRPDGTAVTGPGMPAGVWAPVGLGAQSIALDAAGNVYTANGNDDTVSKIAPDGAAVTGPGMPAGVWWAAASGVGLRAITATPGGILHVVDADGGMTKISPDGRTAWRVTATPGRYGLAVVTDSTGNAYVTGYGFAPGTGMVAKVTPDGALVTGAGMSDGIWAWVEDNAFAMTIDSSEHVFVASNVPYRVWAVPAAGGESQELATVGGGPWGITVDAAGNLYTADGYADQVSKVVPGVGTPRADDVSPAPPDVPAAPTAVAGDGTARVSVAANPADARHGVPTAYIVEAVGDASRRCTATPPSLACSVDGLANGTAYAFTARARLNAWTTSPSGASAAVTPTGTTTPTASSGTAARVTARRLVVGPRGRVVVPLACPANAPGTCRVSGTLSASVPAAAGTARESATRTIGTFRAVAVAPGRTARASARLAPSVMRAYRLAGTRRIGATIATATTFRGAGRASRTQRVTLLFAHPRGVPVAG